MIGQRLWSLRSPNRRRDQIPSPSVPDVRAMAVVCDIPGVLLKGAFPMSFIDVRVLPGRRRYDAEVEANVEDYWQATLRQKPQLFDGVVWCLVSYKVCMGEVAPCLLLEMQETSFKYVIYTHLSDAGKQMDAARLTEGVTQHVEAVVKCGCQWLKEPCVVAVLKARPLKLHAIDQQLHSKITTAQDSISNYQHQDHKGS
eukprot:s3_g18.t9